MTEKGNKEGGTKPTRVNEPEEADSQSLEDVGKRAEELASKGWQASKEAGKVAGVFAKKGWIGFGHWMGMVREKYQADVAEEIEIRRGWREEAEVEDEETHRLKGLGITLNGQEVDAWGAFLPNRGDMVDKIKKAVVKKVEGRGIENLSVASNVMLGAGKKFQRLTGEKRNHTVFQQNLGGGTVITFALRVAKRSEKDLELSWRLFEANVLRSVSAGVGNATLGYFGIAFILVGLVLAVFGGVSLCLVPIGVIMLAWGQISWWLGKRKTRATSMEQLDSRILAQSIDFSLMEVLEEVGISQDEIRVILASDTEGIGQLLK